jgi:hypothetical protein
MGVGVGVGVGVGGVEFVLRSNEDLGRPIPRRAPKVSDSVAVPKSYAEKEREKEKNAHRQSQSTEEKKFKET